VQLDQTPVAAFIKFLSPENAGSLAEINSTAQGTALARNAQSSCLPGTAPIYGFPLARRRAEVGEVAIVPGVMQRQRKMKTGARQRRGAIAGLALKAGKIRQFHGGYVQLMTVWFKVAAAAAGAANGFLYSDGGVDIRVQRAYRGKAPAEPVSCPAPG
jgi:hypothetical protein